MNSFVGIVVTMLLFIFLAKRASIHPFWSKVLVVAAVTIQVAFVVIDLYTKQQPVP